MGTLRAVKDGEQRETPVVKSVAAAAESGTTRELLVAMRNRVAKAVGNESTPARDLAALTKRLAEIVKEIEAIDARDRAEDRSGEGAEDGVFDASTV